jgi:hypothetical protein
MNRPIPTTPREIYEATLSEVHGLHPESRNRVLNCAGAMREFIRNHGAEGMMALAMLGAEAAYREKL